MAGYFLTVLGQIFSMAIMVFVGYLMSRFSMISEKGIKEMSVLLLKVVTPMILISSFQRGFEANLFAEWLTMLGASALCYAVCIAIAEIFYRRRDVPAFAEKRLSIVLPNNGFLAFPLLQALAGELGIFFGSTNVILLNILLWTYGSKQHRPAEKINIGRIIKNPGVISIVLGLLLFCSPWKLPAPVFGAIDAIGSLNTPLAMIVLGAMLAQTDFKTEIKNLDYYKIALLKLVAAPLIMMIIFILLPFSSTVRLVAFICSVTPTATAVSMQSQLYDGDYRFATGAVVIVTVISALTMPVILSVGKLFLGY